MSSPIPEDPYKALGISKDADISAIRCAHRKLVLKFHPDRIKDEAERAKGKDLFQKVQQAYELLSDPVKREQYDNKIKLAELRKDAMTREPVRPATYPMRPSPAPMSSPREYRDGAYYEERVPSSASSYFDNKDRFEEPPSRTSSRKHEDYERRPTSKSGEKEKKSGGSTSKWDKPVAGVSIATAFSLKKKAGEARERVKAREQATKAKNRDREIRRERSENQDRRAFAVDDDGSDSDTVTFVSQSTVRPSKQMPRPKAKPEPARRSPPERNGFRRDDDDDSYDDKHELQFKKSREYQQQSRSNFVRVDFDIHQYWEGEDRVYGRRSGSDSDRRPTSSKGRKPDIDISTARPIPTMPMHTSAPVNLRPHVEEREPSHQRSNTGGILPHEREHRREAPSFGRSQTMPTSRSRKDTAPQKGSKLKPTETQDSGYGSSSSPHTPEMRGTSPTKETTRSSTRYQIVEPAEEDERGHRTVLIDEEDRHRRVLSPQRDRNDRRERSERPEKPKLSTDSRSRPGRVPSGQIPAEMRPQASRHESGRYAQPQSRDSPRTPRDSPPVSRHNSGRKLFGEIPTEEREPAPYSRRYAPEVVSVSPRIDPENVNHGPYHRRRNSQDDRDLDYFPGSRHRQELRHPLGGRRGSVF